MKRAVAGKVEKEARGSRWVRGFDLETPQNTAEGHAAWNRFLAGLDPREACRLCGIDHFPHWLAAAPNWHYLAQYLGERFNHEILVRDALISAIKERRPDPKSEGADWWLAMEHVAPELERFAQLYVQGLIVPMRQALGENKMPSWIRALAA